MNKTKLIAMYLPQYHQIPENDEFWGKGFSDWVTVKNAKPLYEGHQQPRVPLNNNYYDLSLSENVEWQARLAKEYGVYGFGVYHYWFNNEKNLLTKPAEIMRDAHGLGVKYFFAWDNGSWVRSWSNVVGNDWAPLADAEKKKRVGPQVLIPYVLGKEHDWENHYNYVREHFLSENYEVIDNKPVFCIFSYSEEIIPMCEYWNKLAQKDGFAGIYFVFRYKIKKEIPSGYKEFFYEPHYSGWDKISLRRILCKALKTMHLDIEKGINYFDYDKAWKKLLKNAREHESSDIIHGAFVSYDDSPRRGNERSRIVRGESPKKFEKYLKELMVISNSQNKDYVFLTAWNEWGEGAYLEPDELNGFGYLEALKKVVNDV